MMTAGEMRYKLNELRMMLNDGEHTEEQGILVDIIKALDSAEGEYIKKEDALKAICKFCPCGDNGLGLSPCRFPEYCISDELKELNGLPTYSFPDSANIEKIRAEIEESRYITQDPIYARGLETALEIIDKYIGGVKINDKRRNAVQTQ